MIILVAFVFSIVVFGPTQLLAPEATRRGPNFRLQLIDFVDFGELKIGFW